MYHGPCLMTGSLPVYSRLHGLEQNTCAYFPYQTTVLGLFPVTNFKGFDFSHLHHLSWIAVPIVLRQQLKLQRSKMLALDSAFG